MEYSLTFEKPFQIYEKLGQYEYPYRGSCYNNDIHTIIWDKTDELKFVYWGQMKSNHKLFDGIWMIVYSNGSIFEGYYIDNLKNGPGRYIWPNGDYYIGEWSKSKRSGKGEIHYYNGDVFKGEFLDDKMHGIGYWQYANRDYDEENDEYSNQAPISKPVKKMYENGEEVDEIIKEKNKNAKGNKNDKNSDYQNMHLVKNRNQTSCCIIF